MNRISLPIAIAVWLAGSLPLSAQRTGDGEAGPLVEHAQIGKLEDIGMHTKRVMLEPPRDGGGPMTYVSYDTNEETQVGGLGSIIRVNEILAESVGQVLVVTYTNPGSHYLAKRLYFPGEREIRETRGTITRLEGGELTLRNAQGQEERMNLGTGPGAVIDSDRGLLRTGDLKTGQRVIVYFEIPPGVGGLPGTADLVRVE